jgi:hypothetical protein
MKLLKQFDYYAIGLDQRVYSFRSKRYLRAGTNNGGYKIYCLMQNGKKVMKKRARLMYEAFKGNIPKGMTVNHIDENKTNDDIRNLELLTIGDNVRYSAKKRKLKNGRCANKR